MSRAFVNEDAAAHVHEDAGEIPLPLPPGARNYMTPEGAADLRAGLAVLTDEIRPGLAASLAAACRDAGKPDAADSLLLRRRLADTDRRISYLSRMAALIDIVESPENPTRVSFGLTVTVEEPEGSLRTWRIVGIDESNPELGLISWSSPLARGLMGKTRGDTAHIALPEGSQHLVVRDIRA